MRNPVRRLLPVALALASMPVFAQTYSQTVFFGDSLTDSGHFRPALIQLVGPSAAAGGRFTTNPGLVWSEYLADFYGTGANAVSDNQGGLNFAVGGARAGTNTSSSLGAIPSVQTQVSTYLATTGGRADPKALYTVWAGANDLLALQLFADNRPAINAAATAQINTVAALENAGARYVLVPSIPDLGVTPAYAGNGLVRGFGRELSSSYNTALFNGLASANLRVIPLNTYTLLQEVRTNPAPYGITNIFGVACLPQPAPAGTSSLFCSPASYAARDAADTYLFADSVHPTGKGHEILADYAVSILEAPRQIALLPNSVGMVGRSRAERVAAHTAGPDADGMKWWSDVRGDFQRYGDGDVYDGAGPTLTFGVDWNSGNLVYGAFAGYGRQAQDFGRRGGSFDQTDLSLGGFIGWYGDNGAWVNGQLSWSQVDFDIDRTVVLGPSVRKHSGSADGENLSGGISAGWEFGQGALRHGPVVSVLAQRIDVDGYAEDHPEQSTSLAYADQSFDSLIGSVGWQASYAINDHVKPYARLTADREFEDQPKEAFAQLQSMPDTAPYAVPGVEFDQSYATLTFGTRTKVFGLDANVGASVTAGQENANHATVFFTVGGGF